MNYFNLGEVNKKNKGVGAPDFNKNYELFCDKVKTSHHTVQLDKETLYALRSVLEMVLDGNNVNTESVKMMAEHVYTSINFDSRLVV